MVYDGELKGRFVTLRSITVDDAEFSYNIRKDPRFVDIMGQPAKSLEDQREFIEWQREQPGDYYFVVYNRKNEKIGLCGVYDIQGDTGEPGREINIGMPYESVEAELVIFEFMRDVLKLKKTAFVIYKNNKRQLSMIKKKGGYEIKDTVRSGVPAYQFTTYIEDQDKRFDKIRKLLNRVYETEAYERKGSL